MTRDLFGAPYRERKEMVNPSEARSRTASTSDAAGEVGHAALRQQRLTGFVGRNQFVDFPAKLVGKCHAELPRVLLSDGTCGHEVGRFKRTVQHF